MTLSGRIWGYARVSTNEQDTGIQRAALISAGVPGNLLFEEKASGTSLDHREKLTQLLRIVEAGDVLVVTRIDRLARSMRDFANIIHDLKTRGVSLRVTEQNIDTSGAAGALMLNMLAAFAEFETQLRAERQREGIAKAKARGIYKGRKRTVKPDEVKRLKAEGLGPAAISRELKCSRQSVYRAIEAGEN
jgi:DNA invertase Pin-like site-specific DNA recombinase